MKIQVEINRNPEESRRIQADLFFQSTTQSGLRIQKTAPSSRFTFTSGLGGIFWIAHITPVP
jgi:hypothetical protein